MADPIKPGETPNNNQGGGDGGTPNNQNAGDQKPAENAGEQIPDLSKLSSDQLNKVLENPNLWNLPRIKELRDAKAAHDKLLADQQELEKKNLAEQGKFKELADKNAGELTKAQETLKQMTVNQSLTTKLVPLGVVDLDAALKLIDRSKISVDENGNVQGLEAAIEALKTEKSYLFNGQNNTTLGSPSNPQPGQNDTTPKKFKRSQLQDPAFYREHAKEIEAAYLKGDIEDDVTPRR